MLNLHTEKEHIIQNEQFAFKLRNLYLSDRTLFDQVNNIVPFSIHVNRQDNLDIAYLNDQLLKSSPEIETLVEVGAGHLPEISCPFFLEKAREKAKIFKNLNDKNATCSYLQHLSINKEMKYLYANKLILDETFFFNVSNFVENVGIIGKIFEMVFKPIKNGQLLWQKFQSLTKQEKQIIGLIADGNSTKEIGEILFISTHTVKTHRKNIYRKLGINKTSELVRIAIALEVL